LVLLIPIPVFAIGVSPYEATVDVPANSYGELTLTITGSSAVDISLEDIPLTVEPSYASVVDSHVTVRIYGDLSKPTTTYHGYLLILDSGQQIGAGVEINLIVNHTNNQSVTLTATVTNNYQNYSGGSGSVSLPSVSDYVTAPTTANTIPSTDNWTSQPITYEPDEPIPYVPVEGQPLPQQPKSNVGMYIAVIVLLGIIGFVGYNIWKTRKITKKNPTDSSGSPLPK
jgi:hypothetical protein